MPNVREAKLQTVSPHQGAPAYDPQCNHKRPRPLTILFALLALIGLLHFIAVTHSAYPTIAITNCLDLIRYNDYTKTVPFDPHTQQMSAVQFISEVTGGEPSALVQVTSTNAQRLLDVYVYGCTMQSHRPELTLLFKRLGLVQGTVSITQANTLSIGIPDTTLPPGEGTLLQPLEQNIYREYAWHDGAFIQTEFPGLYPVTSRVEAEALQDEANNGLSLPWSDPLLTAEQMARDIFQWPASDPQDTVLDNNGLTAHVLLAQKEPRMEVTVTLQRLIQPGSAGLWFVTAAQTAGITLNQAGLQMPVSSPLTIQGTGALVKGEVSATLFDHTLTPVAPLSNPTFSVNAGGAYSGTIFFTSDTPDQPGLLLIEDIPTKSGKAHSRAQEPEGQLLLTNLTLS